MVLPSEVFAAASIDERVHTRVEPAQPGDNLRHDFRYHDSAQQTGHDVEQEEGKPTNDENSHNCAKSFGSFLLLSKFCQFS